MARTARTKARPATGSSAIEAAIVGRLAIEPATQAIALALVIAVAALYLAGLDYPLVFGDYAFLASERLQTYVRALPVPGTPWLADASFGWLAALHGTQWAWHRAFNVALHATAVVVAFAFFRRVLSAAGGQVPIAAGWIAFAAAALFALHPVAVYGVAYLSARFAVLGGLFALTSLWSTARALQEGGRYAWLIGPLAVAAALACGPAALGVPAAMALLALTLPAGTGGRRAAWLGVLVSAALVVAYLGGWLAVGPAGAAVEASYLAAVAQSCSRFLVYLGFWLVPWTAHMAIDMPEPAAAGSAGAIGLWPGWLGIVGVAALAAAAALLLRRPSGGLVRAAAIAAACALALFLGELLWPRPEASFALHRSYAWMPVVALVPACLVALIPPRAAWVAACAVVAIWLVAAAGTLQTFSSHVALWDDAVRRVERIGPKPEDARVYFNRATVHRRDGHTIAALADYDKALELEPDMTRALRGRAQVYVDEKRYGEALRDLDRILELAPDQVITHADRGLALMQAGRFNEAGHAFDRAIQLGVREPRVFLNRGLARLQLGGLGVAPVALVDIERAIQLDPRYALAYYNRAMIFEQAAAAGIRLRDASSPELMRAVAERNLDQACQLGHAGACERLRAKTEELLPGGSPDVEKVTPEMLRERGLPAR